MSETLMNVLRFALPPLLGAVIGYVTNAIAIKMLFRPLKEIRIAGIRLPLTPGIIPRQRGQLAESIGRMVSERLLTEDTVRLQLNSPNFRSGIKRSVSGITEQVLRKGPDEQSLKSVAEFLEGLEDIVSSVLDNFFHSALFRNLARSVTEKVVTGASRLTIAEIFTDPEKSAERITSIIERALSGNLRNSARRLVETWTLQQLRSNTKIGKFVPTTINDKLEAFLNKIYEPIFEHILDWLNREDIKRELAVRGRKLLRNVLDKLNIFQRFLISAAQYDRVLDERMPEIIEDLLSSVEEAGRDPENKEKLIHFISDGFSSLQNTGIADLSSQYNIDFPGGLNRALDYLFSLIDSPSFSDAVRTRISSLMEENKDSSIGDIAVRLFDVDQEKATDAIAGLIEEWAQKPNAANVISAEIINLLRNFIENLRGRSIGSLVNLEDERKESLDSFLTERILGIIDVRLPDLIATFDVKQLVVEKINGLDMENVEKLLLMVIAKHLKWINLFGALLGSLIGGAQVFLSYFTKI